MEFHSAVTRAHAIRRKLIALQIAIVVPGIQLVGRVRHLRIAHTTLHRIGFLGLATNLLAENRRVIPTKTQVRIRSIPAQKSEGLRAIRIAVQKNVSLFTLHEGKDIDIF